MSKINDYAKFVDTTTSRESKNFMAFIDSTSKLDVQDNMNLPRVMTSAIGMLAESGEFTEVLKKMVFQGIPIVRRLVCQDTPNKNYSF